MILNELRLSTAPLPDEVGCLDCYFFRSIKDAVQVIRQLLVLSCASPGLPLLSAVQIVGKVQETIGTAGINRPPSRRPKRPVYGELMYRPILPLTALPK
jgi:hypothetical protein